MRKGKKSLWGKIWYFLWEDDSLLSWAVNIVLAFVLIKYLVYPGLGMVFGTTHPIVAVISGSMEHDGSFETWWNSPACNGRACTQEEYYSRFNVSKDGFTKFSFRNGFNKGDIMILIGSTPRTTQVGDIIVFYNLRNEPIIHRVVRKWSEEGDTYYQTKGDHNLASIKDASGNALDETRIPSDKVIGKAVVRVPMLGWIKITAVCAINTITRGDALVGCMLGVPR